MLALGRRASPLLYVALGIVAVLHLAGATNAGGAESAPPFDPWFAPVARTSPLALHILEGPLPGLDAGPSLATIFPPDGRMPVSDSAAWPYRTIAFLLLVSDDELGGCTGTLLGPQVLLTAAHCLYDREHSQWRDVAVIPGANGQGQPYGMAIISDARIPVGYTATSDPKYDIAIAVLSGTDFRPSGPYPDVGITLDTWLSSPSAALFTAGYPADKSLASQWSTTGQVTDFDADFLYTTMDAYPGQSGSPIMGNDGANGDPAVIGVFIQEYPETNVAVRMGGQVVDALQTYCVAMGCSFNTRTLGAPAPAPTPTPTATQVPPIPGGGLPRRTIVESLMKS